MGFSFADWRFWRDTAREERQRIMTTSLFDLTDKVALVTGASRGLGLALARGLGQAGARLALNARDEQRLEKTRAALCDEGLTAEAFAFDVTNADRIARGVRAAEEKLGPIEILVNNAGITRRAPLEEMAESDWRAVMDTNVTAAFLVAREVAPGMIARTRGKIINICSVMSEISRPTISPYCASKGALKMLTRSMAVEWAQHNIQANAIGPGYFETDMTRPLIEDPKFDAWVRARAPAGRWGQPEELVGTAVFLASDASSFVNGQVIYVDGGMLSAL